MVKVEYFPKAAKTGAIYYTANLFPVNNTTPSPFLTSTKAQRICIDSKSSRNPLYLKIHEYSRDM
jgi:hypothetical protein